MSYSNGLTVCAVPNRACIEAAPNLRGSFPETRLQDVRPSGRRGTTISV